MLSFPRYALINCDKRSQSNRQSLVNYLNECGWEGDDAYITVCNHVQVKLIDEQDMRMFEQAMNLLNEYISNKDQTEISICKWPWPPVER